MTDGLLPVSCVLEMWEPMEEWELMQTTEVAAWKRVANMGVLQCMFAADAASPVQLVHHVGDVLWMFF